ncbi:Zn-dependent exopeptidase [Pluteus cervinus]|uniref:Zn-dependent exopeptidase n=1 Tax=Pluteus cervinus TaxID=181527 RepID=A0ACD3APS3_9AGAR|nr:Zn-dependent exopeptidase [Pluteus cervinus]
MRFTLRLSAIVLSAVVLVNAAGPIPKKEFEKNKALGLRLLNIELGKYVWRTEFEKFDVMRTNKGFFDVTDVYDPEEDDFKPALVKGEMGVTAVSAFPSGPTRQNVIQPVINTLAIANLQTYVANLTSFNNRYYRSQTGAQASQWILDTVNSIAALNPSVGATGAFFNNTFVQPSIIATIPGKTNGPITILGAHMDSVNQANPTNGRAPGADDDASGSADLLETFRALVVAGFKPSTPVEFHWYAGEEGGLLGSQAIAQSYKRAGKQVKAMLQLDMTAYTKPGTKEVVAFLPDYIDSTLNTFLESLVDEYLSIPWAISPACGYACSDHASWNRQGFPSSMPFETPFGTDNPQIHTTGDTTTVNGFSWTHMLEYAKLGVAYAYELAA